MGIVNKRIANSKLEYYDLDRIIVKITFKIIKVNLPICEIFARKKNSQLF